MRTATNYEQKFFAKFWCKIVFRNPKAWSSGQIIATSQDLTPNGGLVREILYFRENYVAEIL